jgi:hypothetical protein
VQWPRIRRRGVGEEEEEIEGGGKVKDERKEEAGKAKE